MSGERRYIVTDQRLSAQARHKAVRCLQIVDAGGNSLGGVCFAEGEAMYDLPLWVRDLAAENTRLTEVAAAGRVVEPPE